MRRFWQFLSQHRFPGLEFSPKHEAFKHTHKKNTSEMSHKQPHFCRKASNFTQGFLNPVSVQPDIEPRFPPRNRMKNKLPID